MKKLFILLVLVLCFTTVSFINYERETITVVIDAGHGGHDFGANHENVLEKDLVNSVSQKIKLLNQNENVKIHFTRINDEYIDLEKRVTIINDLKPDLVLSLHINKNNNSASSGFEAYVSDESIAYKKSNELAEKLVSFFEKNLPLNNRGVKKAPFMIMKKSKVPAITIEIGFISNENDRSYITDENGQAQIAQTILNFINELKS